jgi:hypothetical protein
VSSNEEALRLYAHHVVRELCLALADHIEVDVIGTDREYEALAGGREFLAITEVSVDPYLDSLVDVLTDLVEDIDDLQNQRAIPDDVAEAREGHHVRRARKLIELLGET